MSGVRTRARGELEGEILSILRDAGEPLGAKDIQDRFTAPVPAYTTVLTSLDRLQAKTLVIRIADSPRKVRFATTRTAAESVSDSMITALDGVEDRRAALLKFAGNLDNDDLALLREALAPRSTRGAKKG